MNRPLREIPHAAPAVRAPPGHAAALAVMAAVAAVAAAAGCASTPIAVAPGPSAQAVPTAPEPSSDWHPLITAPFESPFKELPFPVHEVLQFGDAAAPEECFRRDAPPPRFLDHDLDDYVLCFRRDRLERIEADLRLETGRAEADFARYCDGWLKNATLPARTAANCRGVDGDVAFEARLDEDRSRTITSMSMILSREPDRVP